MSSWSWVVAGYGLLAISLTGYVFWLQRRAWRLARRAGALENRGRS